MATNFYMLVWYLEQLGKKVRAKSKGVKKQGG